MSRRHGPRVLVVVAPLLLVLLNGALAQEEKVDQKQQNFDANFRGPPLGENGFVGENPLPRPQGVVDLGSIGDEFALSDIFNQVDQTFNIDNQLINESGTFQPSFPSNELSKLSNDISSFDVSAGGSVPSEDDSSSLTVAADGFVETSAFQVFHDPSTEAPVDAVPENFSTPEAPDDVLTITFEENPHPFRPPVIRGNRRPGRPGRPNHRRPSRPLRRPIRQPINGRPRHPNKPRRDQPSILSLLTG